jgi:2-succinyl-6-hydroxy-2,4-cyclohexadiene-1-carboxylate synthase
MDLVATSDGVRYAVRSNGAGPAVVLLHGFTGSGADWGPFLPALERLTTTVTVDLLGHGGSDAPADPARHAVERQAADLAAILVAAGLAPAHVVGYSFGARIALRLALDAPELVRSLVLESPSAGIVDAAERAARRASDETLARVAEEEGIAAFVERWEALPLFAAERAGLPEARARLHAARLANDPRGLATSLRGAGQGTMAPLLPVLGRITVPATVITGALDPTGQPRARVVAGAIPGTRLSVVPGVGHAPHREAPALVARELAVHLVRASASCASENCTVLPAPTPAPTPAAAHASHPAVPGRSRP